ncbi:Ubiquinol-cytochrome c reductase complex chaperone CBP3-like protein [Aphelenchoides besseyi]|nr:Ubiquinol-cytochrome c reductase complex chaperone CBP3-like protein [Aphelenchoides besseyi]KAI6210479.1 Ubiquinol-cytochrome c reductase complex chaperone CBP3-like protein [Aphelenchoides besseyi]
MNRHLLFFSARILKPNTSTSRFQVFRFASHSIPNTAKEKQLYDDYVRSSIEKNEKLPQFYWIRKFFRHNPDVEDLQSDLISLLDKSSSQLYYDCANSYPYLTLIKAFGLPDYMSSWYKLTLLHAWLCLLRLQSSLDAAAYKRVLNGLLSSLWFDIDKRLELIGEELNTKFTAKSDLRKMHGLYVQTILEYDEGILDTDCILAAAIWRNLYMSREVDPVQLGAVVRYIRSTAVYLNSLDANEILVSGIKQWKPAELLAVSV